MLLNAVFAPQFVVHAAGFQMRQALRVRSILWTLLWLLIASGGLACTTTESGQAGAAEEQTRERAARTGTEEVGKSGDAEGPASAVEKKLEWVVSAARSSSPPTRDALEKQFSESFLGRIGADGMTDRIRALRAAGASPRLMRTHGEPSASGGIGIVEGDASTPMAAFVYVSPKSNKVVYFDVQRAWAYSEDLPSTWETIAEELAEYGPKSSLLAARIEEGTCSPIYSSGADTPLAIASTSKLYILYAVARAVKKGALSWSQKMAIRDAWKAPPSGTLQRRPAGTELPLATYANRLIGRSDNTAADHLLRLVGRDAVESAVHSTRVSAPERMQPFLMTNEFFKLKYAMPARQAEKYASLNDPQQRAFLQNEVASTSLPSMEELRRATQTPRLVETIEWYASADGLCRLLAAFQGRHRDAAFQPALEAMSASVNQVKHNLVKTEHWTYVGHKAGYEQGVRNLTWLLKAPDGAWYGLVLTVNNPEAEWSGGSTTALELGAAALQVLRASIGSEPGETGDDGERH